MKNNYLKKEIENMINDKWVFHELLSLYTRIKGDGCDEVINPNRDYTSYEYSRFPLEGISVEIIYEI